MRGLVCTRAFRLDETHDCGCRQLRLAPNKKTHVRDQRSKKRAKSCSVNTIRVVKLDQEAMDAYIPVLELDIQVSEKPLPIA